jgi:hypothetical protein
MNEQSRPSHEQTSGPGGLGSIFDESEDLTGHVTVTSGPFAESLPAADMSVGEIRSRFGPRLDIDHRAQAVLDGHDVSNDTIVRQGQVLMFTHRAGEKGISAVSRATKPNHTAAHLPRWRPAVIESPPITLPAPGCSSEQRVSLACPVDAPAPVRREAIVSNFILHARP